MKNRFIGERYPMKKSLHWGTVPNEEKRTKKDKLIFFSPFCSACVIFMILIRIYRMGKFVHARERAREGFAVAKENHHPRSISASRFCCPSVKYSLTSSTSSLIASNSRCLSLMALFIHFNRLLLSERASTSIFRLS